jgi:hypothetical protein
MHRGRPWWHKDPGRGGHGTPAYRYLWQERHRPLPKGAGLTRVCHIEDCVSEDHWVLKAPKAIVNRHTTHTLADLKRAIETLKDPANLIPGRLSWRAPFRQDRVAIHQLAERLGVHPLLVYAAFATLAKAVRSAVLVGDLPANPPPSAPHVPRETKPEPEPELGIGIEPDLETLR